jgi:hypothetical protein
VEEEEEEEAEEEEEEAAFWQRCSRVYMYGAHEAQVRTAMEKFANRDIRVGTARQKVVLE